MLKSVSIVLSFLLFVVHPVFGPVQDPAYLAPESPLALQKNIQVDPYDVAKGIAAAATIPAMVGMSPYFMKKLFAENYNLSNILATDYLLNTSLILLISFYFNFRKSGKEDDVQSNKTKLRLSFYQKVVLIGGAIVSGHVFSIPLKYLALQGSDAITPDSIVRTAPILLVLFSSLSLSGFFKFLSLNEKLTFKKVVGVVLVTLGVFVLISIKKTGVMGETTSFGVIIAILATIAYLISDIFNKTLMELDVMEKRTFLLLAYGVGFITFYISASFLNSGSGLVFSWFVVALALVNLYGWFAKLYAFQYLEATLVRCFISTSPLFTLIWLWVFNQQMPQPFGYLVLALGMFVTGLFLVLWQHNADTNGRAVVKGKKKTRFALRKVRAIPLFEASL